MRRPEIKHAPIREAIERVLESEKRRDAEVSVLLADDSRIREMNRLYRDVDSPTDVLAFAMAEGEFPEVHPEVLGDIVISVERAQEQAGLAHRGLMEELRLLAIHGTLHLLGYEDETVAGRARMRKLAQKYLKAGEGPGR